MLMRRLCQEYRALPSQLMEEDGGLLLQLLEVGAIVDDAAEARNRAESLTPEGVGSWR